jgi:hypothetical protein
MADFIVQPDRHVLGLAAVILALDFSRLIGQEGVLQSSSVGEGHRIGRNLFIWRRGLNIAGPAYDELFMGGGERADARDHGGVAIARAQRPDGGRDLWGALCVGGADLGRGGGAEDA